jgi:hypothetical protein
MIGFLTRARRTSRTPANRALLCLESLEGRALPAAPTISSMTAQVIGSHVVVTGQVLDEAPAQVNVNLTGSVSGTVHPDSSGAFEYIGVSNGFPFVLITAVAIDEGGLISAAFGVSVAPNFDDQAPYITMSVTYGSQRTVTLEGTVYDETPAGIPVAISGVIANQTVYTNSEGHFSLTAVASGLGDVHGQATDIGGHQSNVAIVTLVNNAPQIVDMSVSCMGDNTYVLTGHVLDESPGGLTFTLGGDVDAFRGRLVTVNADGTFSISATITDPTDRGEITAQVTDWWGLTSNLATFMFS